MKLLGVPCDEGRVTRVVWGVSWGEMLETGELTTEHFFRFNRGNLRSSSLRVGGGNMMTHAKLTHTRNNRLDNYQAYTLAMDLFRQVVEDVTPLTSKPVLTRLISQQLGSADSIAANIEEGFGRESRKEYKRFLVIARGSARETMGRCKRLEPWFGSTNVQERCATLDHIISILTKTIIRLSQTSPS